jgi:hypothetical protein
LPGADNPELFKELREKALGAEPDFALLWFALGAISYRRKGGMREALNIMDKGLAVLKTKKKLITRTS